MSNPSVNSGRGLPTGTVTFLFTDIEGSTKLAQSYADKWESLRARHHEILKAAIESNNGYVFQIIGDAFCGSFHTAGDAVRAAAQAQIDFYKEDWGETPVKVRMGINTGTAQASINIDHSGGYKGYTVMARVQRIMSAGHGGQVLISLATEELVRDNLPENVSLRDLGECRLKDLIRPERIHQLLISDLPSEFPPLKTLDVHRHNLPVQLTSFIGREKEIADLAGMIKDHRLITLTGIGGTGKTRLSLQVSADLIDEYPNGVWFVALAPLYDPTLVPQEVASAWQIENQSGQSLSKTLSDYARNKQMLLILDNCEHVLEACASLISDLLHAAPNIKILATSRASLNVEGEITYPVHPLALPEPELNLPLSALTQYEAVRLFIERAVSVRPTFNVTNENAPAVAQVCQRLDGIPLAIELAAARIRALSPDQIAERLDHRFDLLAGGSRTALPRQQTLRATMDWSYELLTEDERDLLNQLSVFAGDFSLEAVESICLPGEESGTGILDLLTALVDNSLVNVVEEFQVSRYELLETVQQYASEKLFVYGELQTTLDRHLAFYVGLAKKGFPHVWVGRTEWVDRFELEYDNFRVAMDHAIATNLESAIQLGISLSMFWDYSFRRKEGYVWAMKILDLTASWKPGKTRAAALLLAGDRASLIGEYQQGQQLLEASLEMTRGFGDMSDLNLTLYNLAAVNWFIGNWVKMREYAEEHLKTSQELNDRRGIHDALLQLGIAVCGLGDNEKGNSLFEESLALARKEDSPNAIAFALASLGKLARINGELAKAWDFYLECAELRRNIRHRSGLANTLLNLGQIALQKNDAVQAKKMFEESLELWRELQMSEVEAYILWGIGGVVGIFGQHELAAHLFGAANAAYEVFHYKMDDLDHMTYDPIIAKVRDRLGEEVFDKEWELGEQMSLSEAIKYAIRNLQ